MGRAFVRFRAFSALVVCALRALFQECGSIGLVETFKRTPLQLFNLPQHFLIPLFPTALRMERGRAVGATVEGHPPRR